MYRWGVTEREFSNRVTSELMIRGKRVLRVCDYTEGRRGVFGLKALGVNIKSAGADYLVLPSDGMDVVLARDIETVRLQLDRERPYFLELKDPSRSGKGRQLHEAEQNRWMQFVRARRQQ